MSAQVARILVTAATGHLGRGVVEKLLETVPADRVAVAVRDPAKAADLAARGVTVHAADYEKPATLDVAFVGVDRLLLVSGNEVGRRLPQHRNAIDAAKRAGIRLVVYTSLLHADRSSMKLLVDEHRATERMLVESGVPYVLLRNGWYHENRTESIDSALSHGAVLGCAGDGRFSGAALADFAAAAAAVLVGEGHAGRTYELAGDTAYTLAEFADEIARQSGKPIVYKDLPPDAFKSILVEAGLPPVIGDIMVEGDTGAARGDLFDDGHALSRLIGRPTTLIADAVAEALGSRRS